MLNVGGVVDILHQVDELRPSLEHVIPLLKDNGISGKVLRHCDLKELKNVRLLVQLTRWTCLLFGFISFRYLSWHLVLGKSSNSWS